MPHLSLDTFFFSSSGAEATEAAMKLARHATGKQNIIVMQGGYHGRTVGMQKAFSKLSTNGARQQLQPCTWCTQ